MNSLKAQWFTFVRNKRCNFKTALNFNTEVKWIG